MGEVQLFPRLGSLKIALTLTQVNLTMSYDRKKSDFLIIDTYQGILIINPTEFLAFF
ncbi:MAG: hypothetical protein ACK47N_14150 [Microcystis sp.]|jgi:hypothetical protein|uniref:hypothetical protein n=1 Tax=Microcystis sp. TaxID=1127 RepID=UPI0026CF6B07